MSEGEPSQTHLATVAIVGRPNVGKSTLFNRLLGKRHAVVANEAGTTRDRNTQKHQIDDYTILLVDTGGLEIGNHENIEANIQLQANTAIEEADIILFVTDVSQELTSDDFAAAEILRKSKKPVLFIANKCDNPKRLTESIFNLYELGFGEPIKVSAIHNTGKAELHHRIHQELTKGNFQKEPSTADAEITNICILGKPNAGKSSLVNALTNSQKIIVSDIAGTTRDATDTEINYEGHKINLIDTAGLRRRGKIEPGIEKFSALRCKQAIERSDVVILLIDGDLGLTSQDSHIAQFALEQSKGLIVAINKIDLFEAGEEQREYLLRRLHRKFTFVPWAPAVFISAKNKKNTRKLLDIALDIKEERQKRIPTAEFNVFMQKITQKHLPASTKIQKPRFMYGSQVTTEPPKFTLFFKNPGNLHFSYPRYIENEIRKEYGFNGTAIQIAFKTKSKEDPK